MIPKKIHYCWFGGNPLPDDFKRYIDSWRKYCLDYEVIEWNESNFDINKYRYAREAYENKKWAFVSDVARLEAIYTYGGIYLDTDVELIKSLTPLLELDCFIAAEDNYDLSTGIGFGAKKGNPIIYENLNEYLNLSFFKSGKLNEITCVEITNKVLRRHGYRNAKKLATYSGVTIFPSEYFSPINLTSNKMKITKNTYAIHHFSATWKKNTFANNQFSRRLIGVKKYTRRNLDNIFGDGTYNDIKMRFKK